MVRISFFWTLGSAHAADKVELTTRVSGVVAGVLVRPGQKVKKGEELLRLDKEIFKARVDEAAAELDGFKADEAEARRELDRAQELYSRTVSSTTELDAAKLRHVSAHSALRADEARFIVATRVLLTVNSGCHLLV